MATLLTSIVYSSLTATGQPNAFGQVFTYQAGTLSPQAVYTTEAGSIPQTNPVQLDAAGTARIWLDPSLTYRFIETTSVASGGVTIRDVDNIGGDNLTQELASTDAGKGAALVGYLPGGVGVQTNRTVAARLLEEAASVNDFPSLSAAAASGVSALMFPAGTYAVAANVTFPMSVHMMPGALLVPAAGITVAFSGTFDAGIYRCFDTSAAGSAITFAPAKTMTGYAEWWGATPNVDSDIARAANVAAINAALVALTRVELLPADYHTNATILHATRGHALVGANCHSFGSTQGFVTNIFCNSATANIVQVGPDTYPGSINAMAQGIYIADIQLRRTVAPTIASNCSGLRMQYVLKATAERIFSTESMYSFQFINTVACRVDRCEARRSLAGAGAGTDIWYGYYSNGDNSASGWGLPGGNASLYLTYSNASCNQTALQSSGSSGFYFDAQYTDIFMSWCEAGDCEVGINVQGNSATGTSFGNADLHISRCIIDTPRRFGLFVRNQAAAGTVDVEGFYCGISALAVSVEASAIYVQDSAGSVAITGGQILLGASSVARGVVVDDSSGVTVIGTQIVDSTASPVLMAGASNCNIRPIINNPGVTGGVAVQLSLTCAANMIAPTIKGKAGAFTKGIDVTGTADARNEYNLTGIDSACITGGSGNKLVRNAVQITATGLTGTNLVSGVVT